MRRWYVPLTVLGLGGLGALLLSERGRTKVRELFSRVQDAPDSLLELNDTLQAELERIQAALDEIAGTVDPHPGMGHTFQP
jgi:hypothetical protein